MTNLQQSVVQEQEQDLGGYFTVSLLTRYRWWLIIGSVLGALIFAVFALSSPRVYQSQSKMIMNLGGESRMSLTAAMFMSGPSGKLSTEMQIINSQHIADQVIAKENLRVDIIDFQSPDSVIEKIKARLLPNDNDREALYNRLIVKSFDAEEMKQGKYLLIVKNNSFILKNKWRTVINNGSFDQPTEFEGIKIILSAGSALKPGQRYLLKVMSVEKSREKFKSRLSVTIPDDKANIVRVAFEHWNPFLAKRVLNLILKEYMAFYKSSQTEDIDYLLSFTEERIKETEEKLQNALLRGQQYQELHKVVDPGAEGTAIIDQLSQLGVQKAQIDIDLNQMKYLSSRMNSKNPTQMLNSVSLLSQNFSAEEGVVAKLTELMADRNKELTYKTEQHPDVIALDNQINSLAKQLTGAIHSRIKQLQTSKNELESLIGGIKGRITQLPAAISDLTLLKSEVAMYQQILGLLRTSQTETSLRQASVETNVRLLDEPTLPEKYSKPDLKRTTFLGLVLGLFTALLAMIIFDNYRKYFVDLSELVGFCNSRIAGYVEKNLETTEIAKYSIATTINIDKMLENSNSLIVVAPIYNDIKLLSDSIKLISAGYEQRKIKLVVLNIYEENYFKFLVGNNIQFQAIKFSEIDKFIPEHKQECDEYRYILPLKSWIGETEPGIVLKSLNASVVIIDWNKNARSEIYSLISDLKRKSKVVFTIPVGISNRIAKNKRVRSMLGIH